MRKTFSSFYFNESLDTEVDIEWREKEYPKYDVFEVIGTFKLDHKIYDVVFGREYINGIDYWNIVFATDDSFDILGNSKNPLRVFGAIAKAMKEWIKKYNPTSFGFDAKEPSRIRVYQRFAKIISNETKYRLDSELKEIIADNGVGGSVYFVFSDSTKNIEWF